ncbi:hypothetical protein LEMLEM_LOCUS24268 [Lemmus lemmus]
MITVRTTEKTRLFWKLRQAEVGSLPLEKSKLNNTVDLNHILSSSVYTVSRSNY